MVTLEQLAARVAQLEARNAITELVSSYAIACDEHDIARIESLFTADASFDSPSGFMRAKGRAAIVDMFIAILKTRGPGYHWTHDNFVRFEGQNADRASGLVLSHAETTPNGVVSLAAMKYDDTYRYEEGTWRFASRSISFLYYVPATGYTEGLSQAERVHVGGRKLPADYPESLAVWQAFDHQHGR
jgi:ketosteroid isomerase-like protein